MDMEPIIIKDWLEKEYAFHSDKIVITKKNKVIREVYHEEIKKITYNPKFGLKDAFFLFFPLYLT